MCVRLLLILTIGLPPSWRSCLAPRARQGSVSRYRGASAKTRVAVARAVANLSNGASYRQGLHAELETLHKGSRPPTRGTVALICSIRRSIDATRPGCGHSRSSIGSIAARDTGVPGLANIGISSDDVTILLHELHAGDRAMERWSRRGDGGSEIHGAPLQTPEIEGRRDGLERPTWAQLCWSSRAESVRMADKQRPTRVGRGASS